MTDIITIAKQLDARIEEISELCHNLQKFGKEKAEAIAEYEKQICLTQIKLKNGVSFELEGQTVKDPAVSNMDKISKGLCWEACLKKEQADANYKSLIVNIDAVKTIISALQSMNKYLTEL